MSTGLTAGPDGSASTQLARAVRNMLRPLVRLLLEKQLGYPFVSNLIKGLYVEVVENEVTIPGRRVTDSRISLLTGIHRREVKRLRGDLLGDAAAPGVVTLGALVVSRWVGDSHYLDAEGKPRALPRRAPKPARSFESLVASVSTDIAPRSILDEWLRLGVVREDEQGFIELLAESFVPQRGFEEKVHFFGRNLRDHIAAGAHNLLAEEPPFLDRSVYYDCLSKESADELAEMAREEGSALLRRVNQRALDLQRADASNQMATHRMTLGSYFYAANELDGAPSAQDDDREK